MKKRGVLSMFFLEFEISGVAVQRIDQNSETWLLSVRIFLVKMTFLLLGL